MPLNNLIVLRRGTTDEWISSNTILASGEPGFDTTNNLLKIGDGINYWQNLTNTAEYSLLSIDKLKLDANTISSTSGNIFMMPLGGKVGINTQNPQDALEVNGSFSATTKSFVIQHPSKPDMKLQYGSLESPYHGVRLTGKDKLKKGICTVQLPDYIKDLVSEDNINFQITNYKHYKTLYVDKIDINNNIVIIKGHRCKTLGELEFFWTFSAIRKDVPNLIVEK
jgi:hypothetical protein